MRGPRFERGSVTAEFAILLPAVMLLFGFLLGLLAMKFEQIRLVEVSAQAGRALARGEPFAEVALRVGEVAPGGVLTVHERAASESSALPNLICATVSKGVGGAFRGFGLVIEEVSCHPPAGL